MSCVVSHELYAVLLKETKRPGVNLRLVVIRINYLILDLIP
jgi:hypothetical protein